MKPIGIIRQIVILIIKHLFMDVVQTIDSDTKNSANISKTESLTSHCNLDKCKSPKNVSMYYIFHTKSLNL